MFFIYIIFIIFVISKYIIMKKSTAENPNEFTTLIEIVNFLVEHKHSDDMKIDMSSMRNLLKIYNDNDLIENFYIMSSDLYGKEANIRVGEYTGEDYHSIEKMANTDITILAIRHNNKDYVLYNIETYDYIKSGSYATYNVSFEYSDFKREILKRVDDSKKIINKFNL